MHFRVSKLFIYLGVFVFIFFLLKENALANNVNNSNEIVVTASKVKQEIDITPTYAQVVTEKKIERFGDHLFVTNLLNQLPGVFVSQSGGIGGIANMFIRGLPVIPKVMMDGVDVESPYYPLPRFNFNSLLPDNINRIEILQGAQSGLWGANAASGVVNIITKKGRGRPHISLKQTYGSFGTTNEYLAFSGQERNISFYLSGAAFDTTGIPQTYSWDRSTGSYSRGGKRDGYHRYSFYNNLGYDFGNGLMVHWIFNTYRSTQYNDICKRTKNNPVCPNNSAPSNLTPQALSNRKEVHFYFTKFNVRKKFKNFKFNLETHYVQNNVYYYSPPKPCPWWKGKKYGSSFNVNYKFLKNTIFVTGANFDKDRAIYDYPSEIDISRKHFGGFLELLQAVGNLRLQLNGREDHYETFGNTFTYKIGTDYFLESTGTIVKSNWGTGFVPPSLLFLYGKKVPHKHRVIEGNPNLSPEKSQTFDVGFIQKIGSKVRISATFFWSKINNLIVLVENRKNHVYTPENVNKCISRGIESTISYEFNNILGFELSDTYTQSGLTQSGATTLISSIPRNVISGSLVLKYKKFYSQLNGRYIGTMYDGSGNQIGRYTLFSVTISYKIDRNIELSLYAQNIFDKFYYSPWNGYGYATPPRSFYATLSWRI